MKKCMYVLVAMFVLTSVASAQNPNPFNLYLGGAISIPNSPAEFADSYKTGLHGFVGVGYSVMPNLQAIGKIEFNRFPLDLGSDQSFLGEDITGGHNNMWMFGVDGRYTFSLPSAPIKPFLLGGVGLARISPTQLEGTSDLVASLNEFQPDTQNKVYFNVGAGIELKAGPMWQVFAQVRYVSVATEGDPATFIPVSLGLKFF